MSSAVELSKVTKRFGSQAAVDQLDLAVPTGAIYGFIGPNGSGKTTTMRMILRIFQPDEGRVTVLDNPHGKAADSRVGYLPEERGLYKRMKVRELLTFFARLKGLYRCREAIDSWLDRLQAGSWANKRIEALSKGMAQKIQFIAAVVARPQLLILDEPFGGLDPVNLDVLRDAVLSLREQGTTIIFSTHDMDDAERLCDTVFMIHEGRKVLDGSLDSIQSQYAADGLKVRLAGGAALPESLPGVLRREPQGRFQVLHLQEAGDSQRVLQKLLSCGPVEHFEVLRPSLHDIFVRIAKPDAGEAAGEPA